MPDNDGVAARVGHTAMEEKKNARNQIEMNDTTLRNAYLVCVR